MKRLMILCLTLCVLASFVVLAAPPVVIQVTYTGESFLYFPDGAFLMYIPWPLQHEDVRVTGEVVHYEDLMGKGHIINDGQGIERGQQFVPDPFYGLLLDRARYTGTMELILFDCCTGTMEGVCTVIHEVFGAADEVLPLYPWAEPQGSPNGKGWWLIGIEIQNYIPVPMP